MTREAGARDEASGTTGSGLDAVIDASALIAPLNEEPGSERVETILPSAAISAVNLAEFVSKLSEHGVPERDLSSALVQLGLIVMAFEEADAIAAGLLRSSTSHLGLSLGDRACIALGRALDVAVYTADQRWADLDDLVRVVVIR